MGFGPPIPQKLKTTLSTSLGSNLQKTNPKNLHLTCHLLRGYPHLISPFSLVLSPLLKLKNAVWECGSDKSPGPDGFTFAFIKSFWVLLASDFKEVMDFFFYHSIISRGCASSFIALIPKSKDPQSWNDFRPISLIGVIYKVIATVLANRLKAVVGSIVSENQSAFIRNRNIMDGPLILSEIISWLKTSNHPTMIMKLDIQKAFDSINSDFLLSTMSQMPFPSRWCEWIKACLMSSRASILINGSPTQEFQCQRGIRQGDPTPSLLFSSHLLWSPSHACFQWLNHREFSVAYNYLTTGQK